MWTFFSIFISPFTCLLVFYLRFLGCDALEGNRYRIIDCTWTQLHSLWEESAEFSTFSLHLSRSVVSWFIEMFGPNKIIEQVDKLQSEVLEMFIQILITALFGRVDCSVTFPSRYASQYST